MTAAQILAEPRRAKRRMAQATKLAANLGARVVGLGVLIPSLTRHGMDLSGDRRAAITTGQAFTVATVLSTVRTTAQAVGLDLSRATVAVVGASGSIGRCVSRMLARDVGRLVLIARSREPLEDLRAQLRTEGARDVTVSQAIEAIREADVVLTVTNATRYLVGPDHLKPGTIVIDYAQPPNVSPEVSERPDILLLWGGLIHAPAIQCHFNFGLLDRHDIFACLAEVLILCREGTQGDLTLGMVEPEQVRRVWHRSRDLGLQPARLQRFGRAVTPEAIARFQGILGAIREHSGGGPSVRPTTGSLEESSSDEESDRGDAMRLGVGSRWMIPEKEEEEALLCRSYSSG
jgi:predicted amino acid dehydrogenase